jgi:hypothetical protein
MRMSIRKLVRTCWVAVEGDLQGGWPTVLYSAPPLAGSAVIRSTTPLKDATSDTSRDVTAAFRPYYRLHGNNQISGEAQDVLWKLEERKVRIADNTDTTPSMSSIKRDVKKKVSPSTGRREDFCLEIQPTACECAPRFARGGSSGLVCHFRGFHLPVATTPIES